MRAATFTTYINAQTDPGLEQAFNRQTQIATSSYATITKAAEQASRVTAGLLGARGSSGVQVNQSIQQRNTALRQTVAVAAEAERASVRLATATRREANEAARAAQSHQNLARGLTTTSTALSVVSGRLDPVASRLNVLTRAVTDLTGVQLGLAAFGATLFAIGRTANTYANLEARVRPFFETQTQVNRAMGDIAGIAARAKAGLEPVVDVYTRLVQVGQNIGLSTRGIAQVTEIATKAANLGGGSQAARDAALMQFGQGLSGDFKGAGQEINSLKEQAPVLFQAILRGYKDLDGTIGVSIGRFRQLQEQSKLSTEGVLDALRRSSSFIDEMAQRMPNTLGRAGTELSNSLTLSIGRFDRMVGLTSTIADAISAIAQNMRVVLALAAGVGTAFAGIKLVGLAQEGAQAARSLLITRAAVEQLGQRRKQIATESLAQHQREIAALNAEQAEIRQNIALLERQRAVATRDRLRAAPDPTSGFAGSTRRAAAAAEDERRAVRALIQERQRLGIISNSLTAAQLRQETASARLAVATRNLASRTSLLRQAGSGLLAMLGGPWGIAFAAAATAVYLLATAETAAERATRQHEAAQRGFAVVVDQTTGKIYDQIGALQRLNQQRVSEANGQTASVGFRRAGGDLLGELSQFTGRDARQEFRRTNRGRVLVDRPEQRTGEQRILNDAVQAFRRGERGSIPALQAVLARADIQRGIPGLSAATGRITELFETLEARRVEVSGAAAQGRILRGQTRDGDVARAFGEAPRTTTGGAGAPLTAAQNDARARELAAQSDVQRTAAELARIRADGKQAGESDEAFQRRLADAYKASTDAIRAQADARRSASAGAAQERREVRDAIQDRRDQAAATRDAALLELANSGGNPNTDAFLTARIRILKTYDDEVNAIDESRAASSSAVSQQIADAARVKALALRQGDRRTDVLAGYEEAPRAIIRARAQVEDLRRMVGTAVDGVAFIGRTAEEIEAIKLLNPLGTGIYTAEMADGDARRIEAGLRRPLNDLFRDYDRAAEIAGLQLQGRDSEAAALQRRNQLLDDGIEFADGDYERLVRAERQQLRINDALESRGRIVNEIQNALDDARETATGVLTSLQTGGSVGDVFKQAYEDFRGQFARIQSRQLVERLFAGSDEKLRALLEGRSAVDTAIGGFSQSVDGLSTQSARGQTALERFSAAAEAAAARLDVVGAGAAGVSGAGAPSGPTSATTPAAVALLRILSAGGATGGDEVVPVVGQRERRPTAAPPLPAPGTPSARAVYNQIGQGLFGNLDKVVDKIRGRTPTFAADGAQLTGSTFFRKIGDSFGTALEGAGQGAIASGFAKALGARQSGTGAAIGGAVGNFLPIPGGGFIGGLVGGTLGGLFEKRNYGTASVSLNQFGEAVGTAGGGRGEGQRGAATGLAGNVAQGINAIAQQLGATITGLPNITVGQYDGKFRVSTSGQTGELSYGRKNNQKSTLFDFGEDQQAAIEFAIRNAISRSVIEGISQASKNIIQSGQELQQAIQKAIAIESIPKRLMQRTDPVRFAVSSLNDEFAKLISYLKEGGATAEQFADAQKLYELERAEAIEQATNQAASAIDQFLKDMVGGSSSPLNRRTTYDNAGEELRKFTADIAGGKVVDQNDLLSAARNFQDASRALNGSSQSFFDDFGMLRSLLEKARDNAGITDVTTLPPSPFSTDKSVESAIASLQSSQSAGLQQQTATLAQKLDRVVEAIENSGVYAATVAGSYRESSIGLLPGFANVR